MPLFDRGACAEIRLRISFRQYLHAVLSEMAKSARSPPDHACPYKLRNLGIVPSVVDLDAQLPMAMSMCASSHPSHLRCPFPPSITLTIRLARSLAITMRCDAVRYDTIILP
ncbi:hypothetical protein PMIN04_002550 [Paraphaeosphaeria minitans]